MTPQQATAINEVGIFAFPPTIPEPPAIPEPLAAKAAGVPPVLLPIHSARKLEQFRVVGRAIDKERLAARQLQAHNLRAQKRSVTALWLSIAVHTLILLTIALWPVASQPSGPQLRLLCNGEGAGDFEGGDAAGGGFAGIDVPCITLDASPQSLQQLECVTPDAPDFESMLTDASTELPTISFLDVELPKELQEEMKKSEAASLQPQLTVADLDFPPLERTLPADFLRKPQSHEPENVSFVDGGGLDVRPNRDGQGDGGGEAAAGNLAGGETAVGEGNNWGLVGDADKKQKAIAMGLDWFARHQSRDGAWRFSLQVSDQKDLCTHPGEEISTTAATGLALLTFLGDGHTHRSTNSPYRDVIFRGLSYLVGSGIEKESGLAYNQRTMYGHAIATIAMCEAYILSKDKNLKSYAEGATQYILNTQHKDGGWRYRPDEPGDVSSSAWQIMALKCAKMAGIEVPQEALERASKFLTSVEADYGAQYGYRPEEAEPRRSLTAAALLCRVYLGWDKETTALVQGAELVADWGPDPESIYYNFYATLLMQHYGEPYWKKWATQVQKELLAQQSQEGCERGSWIFLRDPGSLKGGRLYSTALAILTLEFRYAPILSQR